MLSLRDAAELHTRAVLRSLVERFNPAHDERGRFASGDGSSGAVSATSAADHAWAESHPSGVPAVHALAQRYVQHAGLPSIAVRAAQKLAPETGRSIADAYDSAVSDPTNPETVRAYAALGAEVSAQYDHLLKAGYKVEPWNNPGQPYANSKEMIADVRENKHLFYFRTESSESTAVHSLLPPATNDKFRVVHDIFGHAQGGNQFGPNGETNAYLDHTQMFTPLAIKALTTETLGQNAWFNFSKFNEGKTVTERSFADQKATLLPESLYRDIIAKSKATETRTRTLIERASTDDTEEEDTYLACPLHRPSVK